VYINAEEAAAVFGLLQPQTIELVGGNGLINVQFYGRKTTTGAPTTGTWAVGDTVIDSAGVWHLCTVSGTPGTWVTSSGGGGDVTTHEAASDPHAQYLTSAEGNAAYLGLTGGTITGDLTIAGTGKSYRLRRGGGALDFEGSGTDIYLSVWSGADFTGTQRNKIVFEAGSNVTQMVHEIQFRTATHGTIRHRIDGNAAGNVRFNDDGAAADFVVEGDTDPDLFCVDGSTDQVGIGTNAPARKFDVDGIARGTNLEVAGDNTLTAANWRGRRASTGAPIDQTWAEGDLIVDAAGRWWLCTSGGTPGGWSSPAAGTEPQVDVFTASGTYTKPAGATSVHVKCIGGGGGGGSGRRRADATAGSGGGGGGGGGWSELRLIASAVGATVTVTVGGGGAGAASQNTSSTNGTPGTAGGATTFGNHCRGLGGGGGAGGTTGTATGAGGGAGMFSALSGGTGQTGNGNSAATGVGAGSGGGGGGVNTSNVTGNGGAGGGSNTNGRGGGAGGGAGVNGASPASVLDGGPGTGGGAGGGSAASGTPAGNGGNGAGYGGGGGGGGAGTNGGTGGGAGGTGAGGLCIVTTYF